MPIDVVKTRLQTDVALRRYGAYACARPLSRAQAWRVFAAACTCIPVFSAFLSLTYMDSPQHPSTPPLPPCPRSLPPSLPLSFSLSLSLARLLALLSANIISGASSIIKQDGVGSLFTGLGSTVIGYLIQGSLKYGFYEVFRV